MIVIHHNDLDGRCAASIVGYYASHSNPYLLCASNSELPIQHIRYIEQDYKDQVPEIPENEAVVIVDFSFKPEDMRKVLARASKVIWCDHHKTAEAYGYNLSGIRDFSDKGLSGCECTWRYFFPNEQIPEFVQLIGDYDSWRLKKAPQCFQFYEGMKLRNTDPTSFLWGTLIHPEFPNSINSVTSICYEGETCIKYRDNYCRELRRSFGFLTVIQGHETYVMNAYRFGSAQFGDKMNQFDICCAFIYDGRQWTLSLYSEKVDVSEICRSFGGGGHKGAAGFTSREMPVFLHSNLMRPLGE